MPWTRSITRQLLEGVHVVRHVSGLASLTWMLAAVMFAYGVEQVVQVLVVRDRLGLDPGAVGVLNACVGVGGILAIPFSAWMARGAGPVSCSPCRDS